MISDSEIISQSQKTTNIIDIAGRRFGKLAVIRRDGTTRHGAILWLCVCDCGNSTRVTGASLRKGATNSCGCLRAERTRERRVTHGATRGGQRRPEYEIWTNIIKRCTNPGCAAYARYGGRGITMCERWRTSFAAFLEDVGLRPSAQHTIDRINNDGNYEPANCRWATRSEQARNRGNRQVEYHGRSLTLVEWSEEIGLPLRRLYWRIVIAGWPVEKAFATPVRDCGRRATPRPRPRRRR